MEYKKKRMVVLSNVQIACINLEIHSQEPITLRDLPAAYTPFLREINSVNPSFTVTINLDFNSFPDTERLVKIFENQSWSMFMNGDEYFLSLSPPSLKAARIAHFHRNCKEITVYCSDRLLHKSNGKTTFTNPVSYPLDQILIMYFLAQKEGALIHAAGAEFEGRGYIFPGKSGAGKSTLTKQLACIDGFSLLSDDRIVVRKTENIIRAFGTPWPGEAGIAINRGFDLSGIFFISHAHANKIEEVSPQKALEKLFPVVSIPWYDKEIMVQILDFCGELVSRIPAYEFHFKPDSEAIDVFEEFITR